MLDYRGDRGCGTKVGTFGIVDDWIAPFPSNRFLRSPNVVDRRHHNAADMIAPNGVLSTTTPTLGFISLLVMPRIQITGAPRLIAGNQPLRVDRGLPLRDPLVVLWTSWEVEHSSRIVLKGCK